MPSALAVAVAVCSTAPTVRAEPPRTSRAADAVVRPYGPGTTVRFQSSGTTTRVFVANTKGKVPPLQPSDFTKLGSTPLTTELPPGVYVVEVDGLNVSAESMVLKVGHEPVRVRVDPGNADLSELGSMGLAFSIAAVITGAGLLLIDATSDTRTIAEGKLGLPLLIGGGVVGLGAVAALAAGDTDIRAPQPLRQPPRPSQTSWGLRLAFRF